jgi:hypothetical protein
MKNQPNTSSNILPNNVSLLPLEIQWIEDSERGWIYGILDQMRFANTILTYFQLRFTVRRFCSCWPDCYFRKEENHD